MQQIQDCPYSPEPKIYCANAQSPLPSIDKQKLTNSNIKQVQKIVGSILYYAQVVNMTVLMALCTIASKQTKGSRIHLRKGIPGTWLLGNAPQWNGTILCIKHGGEHPLGCVVFEQTQIPIAEHLASFSWDPYQSMGNPSHLTGLSIHCVQFYNLWCVSHQSQTWSIIPQLPREDDF